MALAIDIGSSSVRVMAYTSDGQPVAGINAHRPYEATVTSDGGAEFDAAPLLDSILNCIDEALQGAHGQTFTAVGVDTFATNLFGLGADGQPVTPIYMWNDTRSRSYVARLDLDPQRAYDRTGTPLHASYWPSRLLWIKDTQPEAFRQAVRWLSIGEWVGLRLFGVARVSTSLAAWTGVLNRRSGAWDAEVLQAARLNEAQLSTISDAPFDHLVDEFAARWPLLKNAIWFPALSDGYAANVGSGATSPERVALTIGTSGAVRVLLEGVPEQVPAGLFCYKVNARQSLLGGALSNAGNVFAWLHQTLAMAHDPFEVTDEPDGHGLTVLPFWAGERSPGWHDGAQAAVLGMTLHTSANDIARAALEAVVYQVAEVDSILCSAFPKPPQVYAAGGVLAGSPGWAQIMADVLGRSVTLCADAQASARGTALLALGVYAEPAISMTYMPRPAFTERYHAARMRQKRLYALLYRFS